MIRIAIFADTLARALSVAEMLSADDKFDIVSAAASRNEHRGREAPPLDVLLAVCVPFERFRSSELPVVALDDSPVAAHLRTPVRARLPLHSSAAEIALAIEAAAHGLTILTAEQAARWLQHDTIHTESEVQEDLTAREVEILRMLADGLTNKEIANRLKISGHTAKFHVAQILAKLQAAGRAEAVAIGIRRGLVPL